MLNQTSGLSLCTLGLHIINFLLGTGTHTHIAWYTGTHNLVFHKKLYTQDLDVMNFLLGM